MLQELMDGCKNIREISFLGSYNLSDDSFKAIATKKKLRKLKLDSKLKYFVYLVDFVLWSYI